MRSAGLAAIILILVASLGPAHGQEMPEPAPTAERSLEDFDPFPEAPETTVQSPATTEAYQAAVQAYYTYRKAGYDHRLEVLEWQSFSTKAIFYVVLVLVLAGIGFAAIQFHAGLHGRGDERAPAEETEISLSLRELKVRSPVLGVIILTISLAFFYMYLVYVYPIRNVF